MSFIEITPYELTDNPFTLIGKDAMLLTAAKADGSCNTMTAGWGSLGYLWGLPVCYCHVRPQRHTYAFTEEAEGLSLTFFDKEYAEVLRFCGRESGREVDKLAACGLTKLTDPDTGIPYFAEARLVLLCRKLYVEDMKAECFVDKRPLRHYEAGDFHRTYVCEIQKILQKDPSKGIR